mmetsp:Transcript_115524/g.246873  ORF Transcript_115524/g.246873 Transcript_115524/m.246873 type:complete len:1348 (-) Transcript_115524:63-4106(-)
MESNVTVSALVEIHGLEGKLLVGAPFGRIDDHDAWKECDVDGQIGRCTDWLADSQEYIVATVEGLSVAVPAANLKPFEPKEAPEGGFDNLWPAEYEDPYFGEDIARSLARKGYCMVQMCLSPERIEEAIGESQQLTEPAGFKQEFEIDYLGRNRGTKTLKMMQDAPDIDPDNALATCDHQLSELGMMLSPQAPSFLGIECASRSDSLVRLPFKSKSEAANSVPEPLDEDDLEKGLVSSHIAWVQSRKICMLYFIENSGGEVELFSKDGTKVVLPIAKRRLLLFRHDRFGFAYNPVSEGSGTSLALQAWLLTPAPAIEVRHVTGPSDEKDMAMGIVGPPRADGCQAQVMSMMTRFPAEINNPDIYWTMLAYGTDCCTEWPFARFDKDLYFMEGSDAPLFGKSYTHHSGHMSHEQLFVFDNMFFNICDAEAQCMTTNQRNGLEVMYDTLRIAGWTKKTLFGASIGVYLGDVGSDWQAFNKFSCCQLWDPDLTCTAVSNSVTPGRMSYIFNMTGPTMTVDTACSASLVAVHFGHMGIVNLNAKCTESDGALCGGTNVVGPVGHVGNCSAHMHSYRGRCFTFDSSADGFQRGEGVGMVFLKISGDIDDLENRIACMVGSCANQDGRSASLTAPNGPSQQAAIRYSLKMGGITPEHVTAVECHGTGTALGDPIEVGAIMAVMEGERDDPLPHTSAKSNFGHLEACAGAAGFTKCINMLRVGTSPPNVHLKAMNAHLEAPGFPRFFEADCVDNRTNSGYAGVSSFGFGGTNARADIYVQCITGPRAKTGYNPAVLDFVISVCPQCLGNMCWKCGAAVPTNAPKEHHKCTLLRDEFADYGVCSWCYEGPVLHGEVIEDVAHTFYSTQDDVKLSIVGTWSAWSEVDDMIKEDDGAYVAWVPLGETRCESFQIFVNGMPEQRIHPICAKATPTARIEGPDNVAAGQNWRIDGLRDMSPTGTYYKVKFYWESHKKSIGWEKVAGVAPDEVLAAGSPGVISSNYRHRLFITGTWVRWEFREMVPSEEKGVYETTFKISRSKVEEFKFVLDKDWNQAIYPGVSEIESQTIVRGPDDGSHEKNFKVHGSLKEEVSVSLRLLDARVTINVNSLTMGELVWDSIPVDEPQHIYYMSGSFNNWTFSPMIADSDDAGAAVHKYCMPISGHGQESFQIVLDKDRARTIYPVTPDAWISGSTIVFGPDEKGHGRNWVIHGEKGKEAEIVLNLDAHDRRKVVTWTLAWPEGKAQELRYYMTGSFNEWQLTPMIPAKDAAGAIIHTYRLTVGDNGLESFQIVVEEDLTRVIHPNCQDVATSGTIFCCGPDDEGDGRNWMIHGKEGYQVDIVLNIGERDRRKWVTWETV